MRNKSSCLLLKKALKPGLVRKKSTTLFQCVDQILEGCRFFTHLHDETIVFDGSHSCQHFGFVFKRDLPEMVVVVFMPGIVHLFADVILQFDSLVQNAGP